jgi:hypothetical protein
MVNLNLSNEFRTISSEILSASTSNIGGLTFVLTNEFFELCTGAEAQCLADEFQCEESKKCIKKSWVCDKDKDCADASDERNCGNA